MYDFSFTYPACSLEYTYDDAARNLYLFTVADSHLYESNITGFLTEVENSDGKFTLVEEFECDEYTEYIIRGTYSYQGIDDSCNAVRFYKDGCTYTTEAALTEYDFIAGLTRAGIPITDMSFSEDGRYICFSEERRKPHIPSLFGARDTYEKGEYMLDLTTFELIKVDVEQVEI